jgi:hypothetical protein
MKAFRASSGTQQISINNAFLWPVPGRVLMVLVKIVAFVGSASTNPFHFLHYMSNLVLHVNGVQHPSEPLTMDCSFPFRATRSYEILFSSTGIYYNFRAYMITL